MSLGCLAVFLCQVEHPSRKRALIYDRRIKNFGKANGMGSLDEFFYHFRIKSRSDSLKLALLAHKGGNGLKKFYGKSL